jgi:DNA mismatch endonuclease, patch repair protein
MADNHTTQQRTKNMQAVRVKNTAPELRVRSLLHRLGYRFRLHRKDLPGTPDLVFPARKSVMFVHGCFWHGHTCTRGKPPSSNIGFWLPKIDGNRKRDNRAVRRLHEDGWKVLTVWECETKDCDRLKQRLCHFLERSRHEPENEKKASCR